MTQPPDIYRPVDARFARWLASNSSATIGYQLSCGMILPEEREVPHGRGSGWQGRALAAVLRECYERRLECPNLEEVEVVALSVLPAPEEVGEEPRPRAMPGVKERWERAVGVTARTVHGILCHGPASGMAGGEVLFTGGTLGAEVSGLNLEQRVDMIWRRPDGTLEAVLVFEEPLYPGNHRPAGDDWRCLLAAAVVRSIYGENPDVHAVWVSGPAARVARIPDEVLDERLGTLVRILARARAFRGLNDAGEGAFYSLAAEPPFFEAASGRRGQRSRGSTWRGTD